ncbi:MAG: hypothetical protein ACI9FB_003461, partial [Candidatus Azotimanducaceae bacterium]
EDYKYFSLISINNFESSFPVALNHLFALYCKGS